MLLASTWRVINFALQNFWRNFWLSVVTVTIMVLSLASISSLGVLAVVSDEAFSRLVDKIDISVYLKPSLKLDEITDLQKDLEKYTDVVGVEVVSSAESLERFRLKHQSNELITESLLELDSNPLGATLTIKSPSNEGYKRILQELKSARYTPYISEAYFDDYRRVIDDVSSLVNRLKRIGQIVSGFFILITLLVVFNTIRMNIYTHREEIGIMRLVGATSWFIRVPFVVEGVLYAALATLITAALFFPSLGMVQPYISSFFGGSSIDLVKYFTQNSFSFFGWQFLGAAGLSIITSIIAMRRYLKV